MQSRVWQFWIDRGGTFTDVSRAIPKAGGTSTKMLSENPGAYEDAALDGIRQFLGLRPMRRSRRSHRRGQNGHDGRHQRAAGAQRATRRCS